MKKLTFVSGKGGVGKTTVSLALALKAARNGQRVLLAEINSEEQVARILGRPPVGYQETTLLPNLIGLNIFPKKSFEEYVVSQLHSRVLYRTVFENRLVRNFMEGTPGLAELMTIGKIYSLCDRFDRIVVDAPATGHCLALLQIAEIVASAVRIGPLRTNAETIDRRLKDPSQTGLVLVTLPEELPVSEALEMRQHLDERFPQMLEAVVLNQFVPQPLTLKERKEFEGSRNRRGASIEAMRLALAQADRSAEYEGLLKERFRRPMGRIPFLFSRTIGLEEIEAVSEELAWTS